MPFTAPYAQVGPHDPPRVQAIKDQDVKDQALLDSIGRGSDWFVGDRSPSPKAKDGSDPGTTSVTIHGPNGQVDQVIVDKDNKVVQGGDPAHQPQTAVKPTAPAKTQAQIDQAAADAHSTAVNGPPKAPPAARIDSPAETQTAASGAQNANTAQQAQQDTAAHDKAQEANASRLADLQASSQAATVARDQAQIAYNNKVADIDARYKDGTLSVDQMRAETERAHQIASDAVAADTQAQQKWRDEQTAQNQAATLAQTTARDNASAADAAAGRTETARANQANETINAASVMQRDAADKQTALNSAATTGANLLQQRSQAAQSILGGWNSAMAGNKNFGLGGALPADFGANLTQGSIQQATDSMGGQSVMDNAAAAVHAANPALSGTPQGAGYTAIMAQMMERSQQQQQATAPQAQPQIDPSTQSSNTAGQLATTGGQAGDAGAVSPGDPRYLGSVIGAAVSHFISPNAGSQDLSNTGPTVRGPV